MSLPLLFCLVFINSKFNSLLMWDYLLLKFDVISVGGVGILNFFVFSGTGNGIFN